MRCIGLAAVTLCTDVACLAWVWWMGGQAVSVPAGTTGGPLLLETMPAKEANETDRLQWKTPRLFIMRRERDCSAD